MIPRIHYSAPTSIDMPETKAVRVSTLTLDLRNFRTIPQSNEKSALEAMISTSPDRFWALTDSLLQDGYLCLQRASSFCGLRSRACS